MPKVICLVIDTSLGLKGANILINYVTFRVCDRCKYPGLMLKTTDSTKPIYTVSLSYTWVLHTWIQPTMDQKYF